jgi:hypothetical protein
MSRPDYLSEPTLRPLKIYATDPMQGRASGNRATITVANDGLAVGPRGSRVEVVDYDGDRDCYYPPVDLNDRAILMRAGLDPSESDPRFHQQMVYAVAMRTIENFDRALGRKIAFRKGRLRLFPHAFHGANAFYDRRLNAVLFGYFRADEDAPGANLPGQTIFTCLSHDIIAHEVTHAVVDRLKRYFLEPTNQDVLAFHEAFADVVALFQHFSFRDMLVEQIQGSRADLASAELLVDMARQYGFARGTGKALRSAIGKPGMVLPTEWADPHDRGAVLVAAVFDGFFRTYQGRIRDLLRIATGGSGVLPAGSLHPDLVNRVADEASRTAQDVLNMCMRAFEYLPPVDVTFGDYLRALITADYEAAPEDERGLRAAMIEAFRQRAIYPEAVVSLAEESLLWTPPAHAVAPVPATPLAQHLVADAQLFVPPRRFGAGAEPEERRARRLSTPVYEALHAWATKYATQLRLAPEQKIQVEGFHSVFRVAPDGQLRIELVAQFVQQDREAAKKLGDGLGGLRLRGGTTVVAAADGTVRYVIAKPLPSRRFPREVNAAALARVDRQCAYAGLCALADPRFNLQCGDDYAANHMKLRMSLAALHQGVMR